MKRTVEITRGEEPMPEYGMVSKLEFDDGSKAYISKKGWSLVTKNGVEIMLPYSEINLIMQETIAQGYVIGQNSNQGGISG